MRRRLLGKVLCRLVDSDLWISRDPYPIAAMRHGISQAVARHVLSHKEVSPKGGWRLDGLLASVAGPLSAQQQRNRRREIHQDVEALLRLGINLHDGRVHMTRKGAVCSKTVGPCSIPAAYLGLVRTRQKRLTCRILAAGGLVQDKEILRRSPQGSGHNNGSMCQRAASTG